MSDISVLIQGPLNSESLNNLEYYKSIGPVIISYWLGDDESILENYDLSGCLLVKSVLPPRDILKHVCNHDTFVYQIHGIRNGLAAVRTRHVIRTRSDESWGNLAPLINKYINSGKVTCGNIFFRKWTAFNFHMGDHLFIGKTETLYSAYTKLITESNAYACTQNPEAIVSYSILDTLDRDRTRDNFRLYFDVIDINELKPFVAQYRHAGVTYRDSFQVHDCVYKSEEI